MQQKATGGIKLVATAARTKRLYIWASALPTESSGAPSVLNVDLRLSCSHTKSKPKILTTKPYGTCTI